MTKLSISNNSIWLRVVLLAVSMGLFILFITYFKDLLTPFVVALMIWYLLVAIHTYLRKIRIMGRHFPHWLCKALPLVILFVCTELTLELIINNIKEMVANYSVYEKTFSIFLMRFGTSLDIETLTVRLQEQIKYLNLPQFLQGTIASLSNMIGTLVIVIIYIVFLLFEESTFSKKMNIIFDTPEKGHRIYKILHAVYVSTNKYLTLKTYISMLIGVLSYFILLLFGVDYAFLWSFLIFVFNYIPYVGSLVATLLPSLFTMVQFGLIWPAVWVFISITILQLIVGNYIEPKLMGKSLNLSPLVVVLSLSFWGYVWGILGMFLSVPITSIILIIMAQFPSTRNVAILLTGNGNIEGILIKN